ncbi:MAG: hypothetical protein P8Y02_09380 [Deinococcales bacterium]
MDQEAIQLSEQIAETLKRRYQTMQDAGDTGGDPFGVLYRQAVTLVAQARHMSERKTEFFSRDVLQRIMNLVMA